MKWLVEIVVEQDDWTPETCNGFPHTISYKRPVEAWSRDSTERAALVEFAGERVVRIVAKLVEEE